jgi:hypothetical protein
MAQPDSPPTETFWREDPFTFIKAEDFDALGIDPKDIPPGTFAAHKHPVQLPSRFGGNAYGFGFFEVYDRLDRKEIELLQSVTFETPEKVKKHYKEINTLYKSVGLLIRFSRLGLPYYLIPIHLVSTSLTRLKDKANEISKIVEFHRKKYLKETYKIGLITHTDDLLANDLSIRFKEHQFHIIGSMEKLRGFNETLDMIILPRDIYQILLLEKFVPISGDMPSKKRLEKYAIYMLGKIYQMLKSDGEIYLLANRSMLKTNQSVKVTFKTIREEKNFNLFSHIFKTRRKYQTKNRSAQVNIFDFQKYLGGLYVEKEVMDELLQGGDPETMDLDDINQLPYLNFPLDSELDYDQEKLWSKVLSIFFDQIFLKPLIPHSVKAAWNRRFSTKGYSPHYMLAYLGQKKSLETTTQQFKEDMVKSPLSGCPLPLVAEYRDSFDYLIRTLGVLNMIKGGSYSGLPEVFMERLRQPLENKTRRYSALNDVIKLMSKINRLERVESYLNPDMIEGSQTRVLKNLEILGLFGFSLEELREVFLIVVGHTAMGRILSGKMNEKALKPVSDLARTYDQSQGLNLLRYCRLMSMAETVASTGPDLKQEQLAELFDLYESMVRIVTNRDMDWDQLLDEKISAIGGIHNKIIRKILKMMNHFQFLDNWSELEQKGEMEKESLADYESERLARIENVIKLVKVIELFENLFLRDDPLQLPIFYRKFLNMEFHGTGRLFERLDSQLAFILLWITVNAARGEVINFNPILADTEPSQIDGRVEKLEEEARGINTSYLDLETLKHLSEQLHEGHTPFIVGTGFQSKLNHKTQALDIDYIDMDENISRLEKLVKKFQGQKMREIPTEDLEALETLFANLESFYQSHLRLLARSDLDFRLPAIQEAWFEKAQRLRERIQSSVTEVIFKPENVYSDLNLLYLHCRSLLHFILPELMALENLQLAGKIYLKSPIIDHTLKSTQKIEALVRGDREGFQDIHVSHRLAQREFGPLAAGTIGLNESQFSSLEALVRNLSGNQHLFDALIKSFILRDLGLIPALRQKYKDEMNPADHAQAGALFLEKEKIPQRYMMDKRAHKYLLTLVRYHDLLHHVIRGEYSLYAIQEVIDFRDRDLFDAFFIGSFIMFSAMREDLVLEDLAHRLLQLRTLCHRVMVGETTLEDHLSEIYLDRGRIYFALQEYTLQGVPEKMAPAEYLESWEGKDSEKAQRIQAGKMIFAMERIFGLRGIRYVEFVDLANSILKVPLRYIYKKRKYYGIGYATFERELFEAHRIYNSMQQLPEEVRHFILQNLVSDYIRIFGFENVSVYLNYENLIKLLLIALLGSQKFRRPQGPVSINFLGMAEEIEKRYEAVNDTLSNVAVEKLWGKRSLLNNFFKAKTGLVLKRDETWTMLSIDFVDKTNISQKISHMGTVIDVEQLKNYYHYSLQSLRKSPFYTDDYERQLEGAFEKRLIEITDLMIDQAKKQMELLKDLRELHNLFNDLMDRALEIGFTDDHWDSIKWYLMNNRTYLGKEFENLIAKRFDRAVDGIKGM